MTQSDDDRIPVLIGAGQVNDRVASGAEGLDSLGLMVSAARAAGADAGAGLLARTDWLGVVSQISFPDYTGRLVSSLSAALGIVPDFAQETALPTGDSPILLINRAANAIGQGRAQVALIVGGEALRTAAKRAAEAAASGQAPGDGGLFARHMPPTTETRHRYGLLTPTDVYPLYENAARAAYGQTLAEGQAETGVIWSLFSKIAAENPAAWLHQARTSETIVTATADNRPVAFPYSKLMVANASVNQGAAVLVTSLALARAAGVAADRIVYVGRGAAAHENENPLMRASFAQSSSMAVSLRRALRLNDLTVRDIDHLELYSCFPCVPKMARRVLGWPADKPASVFGGLTFGGGPIGNYMTHAAASMVHALRASGTNGLLFANGGFATHNHTIVLTKKPLPAGSFPQDYDFQADADAESGAIPVLDEAYEGPAVIETYTVIYGRAGEVRFGVVIGRAPDGRRVIGFVPAEDSRLVECLTSGRVEPVGMPGRVEAAGERRRWVMPA